VNMREKDGGWIVTEKLDKAIVSLQKWMKLMLGMMVVLCNSYITVVVKASCVVMRWLNFCVF